MDATREYVITKVVGGLGRLIDFRFKSFQTIRDMLSVQRYENVPPHLHSEVRTNQNHSTQTSRAGKLWGQDIDPVKFLREQGHRF